MKSEITVFAGRNIKELVRSPISWAFGLALPIGLFAIMQIVMKSIGADAAATVPIFDVSRFTGGVCVFSASFLSLFAAILISSDFAGSFLNRLLSSPMKVHSYILGYMLSLFPIAAAQVVITFVTALCFGLTPTAGLAAAMVFALLFSLLFISIGVIFGSVISAKGAPPMCSAVVQVAALLSGMWFDLDMIGGGFAVFCRVQPFAHCYDIIRYSLSGEWGSVWLPAIVAAAYTVVITVVAVLLFKRRTKRV